MQNKNVYIVISFMCNAKISLRKVVIFWKTSTQMHINPVFNNQFTKSSFLDYDYLKHILSDDGKQKFNKEPHY